MKEVVLVTGAVFGLLSVIMGALGAHAFKKKLSAERLVGFDKAVKYQTYAAFFLLVIGFAFDFQIGMERTIAWLMIFGALLFSGSVYLLSFQEVWNVRLKPLVPLTPLGGVLMIVSWLFLILRLAKWS